jgi:putative phage-type endonuclease
MPKIEGLIQNTPEWLVHRVGMATASKVADVIGRKKQTKSQAEKGITPDYLQERDNYLWDVVIERLTGRAADHYCSPAMEHGIEFEPLARAAYELEKDVEVEPGGFWIHPKMEWFGASPDGLVGENGLLEIKCPTTKVHLQYLSDDVVPLEYAPQMLAQMACTERKWCDFVSYDNRLPADLQLFVKRFNRDDALIEAMEAEVALFLDDVILRLGELAKRIEARKAVAEPF